MQSPLVNTAGTVTAASELIALICSTQIVTDPVLLLGMADPTYLPQTAAPDTLSDSEQELAAAAALARSSSPSAGAAVKQQQAYIWNEKFAVSLAVHSPST